LKIRVWKNKLLKAIKKKNDNQTEEEISLRKASDDKVSKMINRN
jgi:hypothetical protein